MTQFRGLFQGDIGVIELKCGCTGLGVWDYKSLTIRGYGFGVQGLMSGRCKQRPKNAIGSCVV